MTACVFCRLVAGTLPVAIVHRDDRVVAFMDAGQVNDGHVIVATVRHVETIYGIDDDEAAAAFRLAARIARTVKREFGAAGVSILQANEPAGFQTVPHFHLHVLPRHAGDGVGLEWPAKRPPFERLAALGAIACGTGIVGRPGSAHARALIALRQRDGLGLARHGREAPLAPVVLRLLDALARARDEVPPEEALAVEPRAADQHRARGRAPIPSAPPALDHAEVVTGSPSTARSASTA